MAVTIATSTDLSPFVALPQMPLIQQVGGAHVAIFRASNGSLLWSQSATGSAWSAAAALPGNPTALGLSCAVWTGSTLSLWYGQAAQITLYQATYSASGASWSNQTSSTYAPFPSSLTGAGYGFVAASYDGTLWHVICQLTSTAAGATYDLGVFATPGGGTVQTKLDLAWQHTNITNLQCVRTGTWFYAAFSDVGRGRITLLPIVWASGAYTFTSGAAETVATGAAWAAVMVLEIDSSLSFVLNEAGPLYAVKRNAAQSYGQPIPLAATTIPGWTPRISQDPITGNLQMAYTTTINRTTGEIYILSRTTGTWGQPSLAAGGDGSGYQYPIASPTILSGSADLMYQIGTGSVGTLTYGGITSAAVPGTPTPIAPVGTITTLTPTISWQANVPAGSPPPSGFEVFVFRGSDSATMWDSGEVDTSATSVVYNSVQGITPSP